MLTNEHVITAKQFLIDSDGYFDRGDQMQGSEKLWGAAAHAIMAAAQQRGWKFGTHRYMCEAADSLAEELGVPLVSSDFGLAEKFHANFYHDFMEDFQLRRDRSAVHRLVNRVLSLPEFSSID